MNMGHNKKCNSHVFFIEFLTSMHHLLAFLILTELEMKSPDKDWSTGQETYSAA
jgi:hypothetical protein